MIASYLSQLDNLKGINIDMFNLWRECGCEDEYIDKSGINICWENFDEGLDVLKELQSCIWSVRIQ